MKESEKVKEKWYKDGYTLLAEANSPRVDKLFKIYAEDKYKARIYFMNDSGGFTRERLALFTKKNGDFDIVLFSRKFGISKTNRMYNRESRVYQLKYSKNKFTLISRGHKGVSNFTPPTFSNIENKGYTLGIDARNIVRNVLSNRFAWVRFIIETSPLHNTSLNTFINKKLFTLKAALKHHYKCTYPVAKLILKYNQKHSVVGNIRYYMDYINNIESLKEQWFQDFELLYDTLKMAKTLDKRVNASWTTRRLKEEHDKWSKIITDVMFVDGDRPMAIEKKFKEFAEFSGYKMLTTTKEMAYEGKRMNHCVATYVGNVERGQSGIYTIDDYTLELRKQWDSETMETLLVINQFRGYSNCDAPGYLLIQVKKKLWEFNYKKQPKITETITTDSYKDYPEWSADPTDDEIFDWQPVRLNDELPF